jgi:hypothetical protein
MIIRVTFSTLLTPLNKYLCGCRITLLSCERHVINHVVENFVPFGFKIALLSLQKTCDKICDGKLLFLFGFRIALQQKIYDKIVYKTSTFSGLKVTFAHKRVQNILIGCMLRDHYYVT